MNNSFNHPTNLALIKRSRSCLGLLVMAGLMTLGAAPLSSGTTRPIPTVERVLPAVPPGTQPGGQMFLRAIVTGDGSAEVTFYLGEEPRYNRNALEIGSTTASSGTVGVPAFIPQDVPPGLYYVLACIRSNCVASRGTIQIIGQELSAVDESLDTSVLSAPPGPEYFPESTTGMEVGSPFPCPLSTHGQYPSTCVWVTTQLQMPPTMTGLALWYCPIANPHPYLVAIGFDPLWEDQSFGLFLKTRPVSFTKYKTDFFGPFSYRGTGDRGYVLISWTSRDRTRGAYIQPRYLCTTRPSDSAYP